MKKYSFASGFCRGKYALMTAMGIWLLSAGQVALADSMAYVGTGAGEFGAIDLNTGVFSDIGPIGFSPAGLGVANGTLYLTNWEQPNGALYSVNTSNGSLTTVGSSTVAYFDLGSTTAGGLYAVGLDHNLYSINPTTGSDSLIGATGVSFGSWNGMSTNSSVLYFSAGSSLYTLNTSTGAATLVGNMGSQMGAILLENGVLWGGEITPTSSIATLNTITGAATTGPAVTGAGSGNVWGLAQYPIPASVPIPGAIWLFGSTLACFIGYNRRKSIQE